MIVSNAIGQEAQVRALLLAGMVGWTPNQVSAWMEWRFDPEHMYVFWKDERIVSCLQLRMTVLAMKDRQMEAAVPVLFCTHPDYRMQRNFGKLLDAALSTSASNQMLMLAVTDQVKLLEKRSFQTVARMREYWMHSADLPGGLSSHVYPWRPGEDLYGLYSRFITNFPVHVKLDADTFSDCLHYAHACRKRVWVAYGPDRNPEGFCVASVWKDQVKLEVVCYDNTRALANLLNKAASYKSLITVTTGPNERLERLVPEAQFRLKDSVMARLSNWKLTSKWLGADLRTASDLFDHLYAPQWLQMLW